MSQIALRPPRFLGEKVPMREQTVQEKIQSSLGTDWTVEQTQEGYRATQTPIKYLAEKDTRTKKIRQGTSERYSTYIPKEYILDESGNVTKEISRGVYTSDKYESKKGWEYVQNTPFESEVTDYTKQTRETYGKRELASGRESLKMTSQLENGVYREKNIIHQTDPEYQRMKRTPEQAKLIREYGYPIRRTEQYSVAGMTKDQRREYYRLKSKQQTAQLALEAKAQKIARQETEKFRQTLSYESQKYASGIFKQQVKEEETTPTKTVNYNFGFVGESSQKQFEFKTPPLNREVAGTTRTDMGTKIFLPEGVGKRQPGTIDVAPKQTGVAFVEKQIDKISMAGSRARAEGKPISGYGFALAEFGTSVPVGAYKFVRSFMPDNIVYTVGGMFDPESYKQLGQQLATRPAKTTGEITGGIGVSYGIGKLVQYRRESVKSSTATPKGGESQEGTTQVLKDEFQSRFSKDKNIDIVNKPELDFYKEKTGKGEIDITVYSSKKVLNEKGEIINTPSIIKLRDEIVGKPSKIGSYYITTDSEIVSGATPVKSSVETGSIKIAKDIETTLTKPKIIATSKWLPGDVRQVIVKDGVPYVPDYFGSTIRPFNSQEFTLSTVYNNVGLSAGQKTLINNKGLNYVTSIKTQYGEISIEAKPSPGTQTTIPSFIPKEKPIEVSLFYSKPKPATPTTATTPVENYMMGAESKSVLIQDVKPVEKYAPATEVIKGSLKVYPEYGIIQPEKTTATTPKPVAIPTKTQTVNIAGFGLIQNYNSPSKISPLQETPSINKQFSSNGIAIKPVSESILLPSSNIKPEELSAYKNTAKVEAVNLTSPISENVVSTRPEMNLETRTETRLDMKLQTDLITELTTDTTISTQKTPPIKEVVPKPPINTPFRFTIEEEKKKEGKYEVQVREKGVFKTIGFKTTPQEAFKFAQKKVQDTASASLRIKNIGSTEKIGNLGKSILPRNAFYESKKEPGVFIQRREKRISSYGEKREITFKGLMINKNKNVFGRR